MTRLESLCKFNNQQGGTIHDFNSHYKKDFINLSNLDFFKFLYSENLKKNYFNNPSEYSFREDELTCVVERMTSAIDRMSFNKDTKSFKDTCKHLGIKNTYSSILEYIRKGV